MPRWNIHFNLRVGTQDTEVTRDLIEARLLAAMVRGIPIPPASRANIAALNIRRAIRGTTAIEGNQLDDQRFSEVVTAVESGEPVTGETDPEVAEVRNAARVAHLVRNLPPGPVTEHLVARFHALLTEGIRYPYNEPGRYRHHPARAGDYIPPEGYDRIASLMREFIEWLNTGAARHWDPIIQAIAAHFMLVSIHPFGDGNGRTSRAVESYLLHQAGINARGYYSLANFYYRNRDRYISMLDHVRFVSDPDLTPFVHFALRGLVQELREIHAQVLQVVRVIAFRDYARELLHGAGRLRTPAGERQLNLLLGLDTPVPLRSLREGGHQLAQLYRRVGPKTLARDIKTLTDLGLIVVDRGDLHANVAAMDRYSG